MTSTKTLAVAICGAAFGGFLTGYNSTYSPAIPPPVVKQEVLYNTPFTEATPLTSAETARSNVVFDMASTTMAVHFLDADTWQQVRPPGAQGFTLNDNKHCDIYLPAADYTITATPAYGSAQWRDNTSGEILAHEMLHCLHGSWHPAWDEIKARTAKELITAGPVIWPQTQPVQFTAEELTLAKECILPAGGRRYMLAVCAGVKHVSMGIYIDSDMVGFPVTTSGTISQGPFQHSLVSVLRQTSPPAVFQYNVVAGGDLR